jgi:predicted nucleic acid-binding protein
MTQILIDTDVILDFFFDRQPFSENASKIFSLSESKKIISFLTPVIISNVYYLLRQTEYSGQTEPLNPVKLSHSFRSNWVLRHFW